MVAITSLGSKLIWPGYTAIGVSKATLEALVRYLAVELAPKDICVNAVGASFVPTEVGLSYAVGGGEDSEDASWKTTPAGRMVSPEDMAGVVAFLCSSDAFMIRGQVVTVDGGFSLTSLSLKGKGGEN